MFLGCEKEERGRWGGREARGGGEERGGVREKVRFSGRGREGGPFFYVSRRFLIGRRRERGSRVSRREGGKRGWRRVCGTGGGER